MAAGRGDFERAPPSGWPRTSARSSRGRRLADAGGSAGAAGRRRVRRHAARARPRAAIARETAAGRRRCRPPARLRGREHQRRRRLGAAAAAIGSRPAHRRHAAVEREPADDRQRRRLAVGQHARRGEDAERDRQVERGADLAHVGRREVDRDARRRKRETRSCGSRSARGRGSRARSRRAGRPSSRRQTAGETSTSTDTGTASMPTTAAAVTREHARRYEQGLEPASRMRRTIACSAIVRSALQILQIVGALELDCKNLRASGLVAGGRVSRSPTLDRSLTTAGSSCLRSSTVVSNCRAMLKSVSPGRTR